ncbi:MAG: TrmH family RNA methyltransferase [Terriglobales bacterium]
MPSAPEPIGRHHPLLTAFRRAFREGPAAGGLLAVEGATLIGEALRSGYALDAVLFSNAGWTQWGAKLQPQLSRHVRSTLAGDTAFAAAMDSDHPPGVAALVRFTPATLEAAFQPRPAAPPLLAAACGLQDPGNLGTLIRAADAFGAAGVVTLEDTVSPFNPKSVRASAGSIFHLPVAARVPAAELIAACRAHGLALVAAEARADAAAPAADTLAGPVCLLLGQEAGGLDRALRRASDAIVAIPMRPGVDSLNAAIAGAILLYEAARQRAAC